MAADVQLHALQIAAPKHKAADNVTILPQNDVVPDAVEHEGKGGRSRQALSFAKNRAQGERRQRAAAAATA